MNYRGMWAIYKYEINRALRTVTQSLLAPVISTFLYFIVFGSAIGGTIRDIGGVEYGAFIVPGLIMLTVLTQSMTNAAFAIFFPNFVGTIYEIQSAPLSFVESSFAYISAATTKSVVIATVVFVSAQFFVSFTVMHPFWMAFFLLMTCITFSMIGFLIGLIADGFEQLQIVPLLVITPLTFLGGSFYSIDMLPPFWRTVSLFNPVVYLVSGFRWSFYEKSDVSFNLSVTMILFFMMVAFSIVTWLVRTGRTLPD